MTDLILLGGGGHAKVLMDVVQAQNSRIAGYSDPNPCAWLDAIAITRIAEAQLGASSQLIMGFVGLDCQALERRYSIMRSYRDKGAYFPTLIHPSATISPTAHIAPGAQILPGAIINAYATIGEGCVINSKAVVEHDAVIATGVHIAPGAVVLGGATIGGFSYIGSNAVVVQNSQIPPRTFVKALTIHK